MMPAACNLSMAQVGATPTATTKSFAFSSMMISMSSANFPPFARNRGDDLQRMTQLISEMKSGSDHGMDVTCVVFIGPPGIILCCRHLQPRTDGRAAQALIEACLGYQQVDAKRQIGSSKLRLQILYHGAKHLWRIAHTSCHGRCSAAGPGCCIRTARSSVTEAATYVGGRKKKRRTYHADAPCIRHSCCKVRARRLQRDIGRHQLDPRRSRRYLVHAREHHWVRHA